MTAAWVGVDPGGTETGIVARQRVECLCRTVIVRADQPMAVYIGEVIDAVRAALDIAEDGVIDPEYRQDNVAVEGLNAPSPHLGLTSVRGLINTAQVLGAVLAHWPTAVVVPPARNGAGPIAAYPADLRPSRGNGKGHDRMRHCRSAWDVAGFAPRLARLQQQGANTP